MQYNDHMTQKLREALNREPSIYRVSQETGLQKASLMRFARGEHGLQLSKAAILASYLGFELRRVRHSKKG
jgi:hypothetical protein